MDVSTTIPEAIKEPTNQDALNIEVIIARSLGYDNSPSIADPDTMQKTIPKPRIMRATIYMPAEKGSVLGERLGREGSQ